MVADVFHTMIFPPSWLMQDLLLKAAYVIHTTYVPFPLNPIRCSVSSWLIGSANNCCLCGLLRSAARRQRRPGRRRHSPAFLNSLPYTRRQAWRFSVSSSESSLLSLLTCIPPILSLLLSPFLDEILLFLPPLKLEGSVESMVSSQTLCSSFEHSELHWWMNFLKSGPNANATTKWVNANAKGRGIG